MTCGLSLLCVHLPPAFPALLRRLGGTLYFLMGAMQVRHRRYTLQDVEC